ncbi:TPR-like protein [Byssothecium circinans]|uniref:TPR-like protein n=1 Tax=Byssothecium circinans TaxID=147558 RepID=A0A6A5TUH3_9PLEO|nr:TPR-like protein [Byssothecium circinans]
MLGDNPANAPTSTDSAANVIEAMRLHYTHACITTEIGDFKHSLHHFERAKSCHDQLTAQRHPGLTQMELRNYVGGIANSLNGLGRNNEAEGFYLESLKLGTPDDIDSPYEVNICRCRWAAGRFKEAGDRLCELIELREKTYGKNDTRNYIMGHMLYCLGNVRISQNRENEAYALHQRSLDCWLKTYGPEHHKTGDALHKRGWHEARLGNLDKARKYLERALGVYKSGSEQKFRCGEIARSNFKLAMVFKQLGGGKKSKDYLDDAEELRKELQKDDYTPTANEEVYDGLVSLWAR